MFDVQISHKPAFRVLGKKAWRNFNTFDNAMKLFEEAHSQGLITKLKALSEGRETGSEFIGITVISESGGIDYYFSAETTSQAESAEFVSIIIPAACWAIFKGKNNTLEEISALERYGYSEWLPASNYVLADVPQINVFCKKHTELWLPVEEVTEENTMKLRPYLTYNGNCAEAIDLYKEAFQTEVIQIMRFSDMPEMPGFDIPEEFKDRILQASLKFGADFIRLSDCGPGQPLNEAESERLSIAVETTMDKTKHAFNVLAKEGRVGMPLGETFYSPLAGVVFDKFGVMWNFVSTK